MLARHFDEWTYFAYRRSFDRSATSHLFAHGGARFFVEFEQVPNRDSRVFLTDDRDRLGLRRLALDWRLSATDIRTARALGDAIGRRTGRQLDGGTCWRRPLSELVARWA